MKVLLIFLFSFFIICISGQRNREAEDSARIILRQKFFYEENGKFGVKDSLDKKLTNATFDNIDFFDENLFVVEKNSLFGVINHLGKTIVPAQYKSVKNSKSNFANANANTKEKLEKYLKDVIFSYTNEDLYDEQYGIYSKNGKLLYPPIIHRFSEIKEYKNIVYFIVIEYPKTEGFSGKYNENTLKVSQNRLVKFENNQFSAQSIKVDYDDLGFLPIKNILFYKEGFKGGFYNMETEQKTERKYKHYRVFNNKIYAAKENFYNYILDENFNETISKDSISNIANGYIYLKEGVNFRLMKNGMKSKFSYPLIESVSHYYDYGNYSKNENYENYLSQLFKFHPSKGKYGLIDFNGNIFVEPKYEIINVYPLRKYVEESYDEKMEDYYKKNHLDYLIIPGGFFGPEGAYFKEFKIINSVGKEIVYLDEKNYNTYVTDNNFGRYSKKGITKDFFYSSSNLQNGFFVYDIRNQKIVLASDKGYFSLRKNFGFVRRFYDEKKQENTVTYYSNKLNKLYEEKTAIKEYDEIERSVIKSKAIYFFNNNKVGLIDFEEKEVLPAKYDNIKIVNFHYYNNYYRSEEDLITSFIVTKNGKVGLLNDVYKKVIPLEYDEIKYLSNPYFEAYLVKKNNKYGLVSKNNLLLVPIIYENEIFFDSERKRFDIKNEYKTVFMLDYRQSHKNSWYNVYNDNNSYIITKGVITKVDK
ncbi:hypothetical protein AB670_00196 [Chryseobacterium sp. MOF25P]|uniref:WG repeat-containing protein n=1 Tax=unclassified Chryseobacterium TaxID=2593645 RepID=UPI0008056BA3|nr:MULTISPECIES: WG repeat-containing protein [unclassified Chryseobacterium]OBW43433.1 hypothetical protein AB670_00196 [Chryseobacterium sp. MOF25P]OBW44359.1 hypothetical protein AB671_03560 [Chryseobacterium sp. BGARF1]